MILLMKLSDDPDGGKIGITNGNGYSLPRKIAIIYSEVKREYFPTEVQYITEKDALEDAKLVAANIEKLNIKTVLIPANSKLTSQLLIEKPGIVFNLVGSVRGQEFLASTIPGILEFLNLPYIGAGILGESLSYNKFLIHKLLEQNGIPTPHYQLFNTPADPIDLHLRFPLISKLNEIHGAVEINKDSVSDNEKQLKKRLKFLMDTYKQPILVEEYIVGREITVILLEGINKKIYMAEKKFKLKGRKYVFATFDDQWKAKEDSFVYKKFDSEILKEYVKKAFEVTKMDDYGKFDIRLDSSNRYYFLDCNSNPAFSPKGTALSDILSLYEIPFMEILKRLIQNTVRDAELR